MGCLYIISGPEGKRYVGITMKTAGQRWASHVRVAKSSKHPGYLQSALRKHGRESFEVRTIMTSNDWEFLCYLEKGMVSALGSMAPGGYNLQPGGGGYHGGTKKPRVLSEEHKRKIGDAFRGRPWSEARRRNIPDVTRNPSEETRRKISEAQKRAYAEGRPRRGRDF